MKGIPEHLRTGIVIGIWGNEKTCKTTLALTSPKPIAYFEFDLGGFKRASSRFREEIESGLVISKTYYIPPQMGVRLTGYKEAWYSFVVDFVKALEDDNVATMVVDTSTKCWEVCHKAFLQEKQDVQMDSNNKLRSGESRLRESLLPVEYGEPNARMRAILYAPRTRNRNLILVHYEGDEYVNKPNPRSGIIESVASGRRTMEGFRHTQDSVDLMVQTIRENGKLPKGIISLCGLSISSEGFEAVEPTFEKIMFKVASSRGEIEVEEVVHVVS